MDTPNYARGILIGAFILVALFVSCKILSKCCGCSIKEPNRISDPAIRDRYSDIAPQIYAELKDPKIEGIKKILLDENKGIREN